MEGRNRVIIENVTPEINSGKFPVKRVVHEKVEVQADIFCDGHDSIRAELLYRNSDQKDWAIAELTYLVNDRWQGIFTVREQGIFLYTIRAWVDKTKTWYNDIIKKINAGMDVGLEIASGLQIIREISDAYPEMIFNDREYMANVSSRFDSPASHAMNLEWLISTEFYELLLRYPLRLFVTRYPSDLQVYVERPKAGFSTWYEFFPRSVNSGAGKQGTLKDCTAHLDYVADMGFDVVYLPPIHPVGITKRKGKNNSAEAKQGEPGSPWAIGSPDGGHKSIHKELGNFDDLKNLIARAGEYNMEIALDIALQCSPDHPYITEHPEWFRQRPDGSIRFAENPPKKYEDIYPFDFECDNWRELWDELKSIFIFWIGQGIRIFRVDNPHTKSLAFWGWLINDIHKEYPDIIFLSEAFTRPKLMYQLAKLGFTQSYTYFTWRNEKWEIKQYFEELFHTGVREYFRPNLWPNTPDILPEFLQLSGRPGFLIRLILAATLSSSYGIYGPAFELMENVPKTYGSEEYLDSEKYEIRHWDLASRKSLKPFIKLINKIRKENPALHKNFSIKFYETGNENIIAYSKHTDDYSNIILTAVNLDPYHTHSGYISFPENTFGFSETDKYQVQDLLGGTYFLWSGPTNYVELNPGVSPGHIFRIRKKLRTEKDFDYFL